MDTTKREVLGVFFRSDLKYSEFERKIYSIGDLLGQIGGFLGTLTAVGALLIGSIADRLYYGSILSKIY